MVLIMVALLSLYYHGDNNACEYGTCTQPHHDVIELSIARLCSTDRLVFCAESFYQYKEHTPTASMESMCENDDILRLSSVKDDKLKTCMKTLFICAKANQESIMFIQPWGFVIYGVSVSRLRADNTREMYVRYLTPLKWWKGHSITMDDA